MLNSDRQHRRSSYRSQDSGKPFKEYMADPKHNEL